VALEDCRELKEYKEDRVSKELKVLGYKVPKVLLVTGV
jgi:hypothetical protein